MPRPSSAGKTVETNTLIKNLRLLDLDEEFDWPGIGLGTFAAASSVQEQQQRSYAALWLFYKLFMLWDPEWTRSTLQDLFPPLESKQSTELRLRVYKQLAVLKQNGTFANDLVLRRTMFDDCKGAKFEELLTTFSSLVLQKVVSRAEHDGSRVQQMAAGTLPLDREQRIPLSLAYRSGCGSVLKQRKAHEQRWRHMQSTLRMEENELHRASMHLEEVISKRQEKRIPKRTLERLRATMENHWRGDRDWIEIILQSDLHRPRASFLERPFIEIWSHVCKGTLYQVQPRRNDSLLQELQARVNQQDERLARWRNIHRDVLDRVSEPDTDDPILSQALDEEHDSTVAASQENVMTYAANEKAELNERSRASRSLALDSAWSTPRGDNPLSHTSFESPMNRNMSTRDPRPATPESYTNSKLPMGSPGGEDASFSPREAMAEQILSSVANAAPTPARVPLTLAERTRMSMARVSPQKRATPKRELEDIPSGRPISTAAPVEARQSERPSYASLAERTRQSISHVKNGSSPHTRRKSRVSRVSNMYPVNQFETPKKVAYSMIDSPDVSLLEERLDALAVDEESAFQSRPLLAKSPLLQPQLDEVVESVDIPSR